MTRTRDKNYAAIASRYAGDVVSGKILACQWTLKACRRQLDDLEKSKSKSYPYRFDKDKASRICRFIEMLPHIKGEWAKSGARIELQPWQIFILTTVFGWVRRETGLRRFKTVYVEMPRKGGKSRRICGKGFGFTTEALEAEPSPNQSMRFNYCGLQSVQVNAPFINIRIRSRRSLV